MQLIMFRSIPGRLNPPKVRSELVVAPYPHNAVVFPFTLTVPAHSSKSFAFGFASAFVLYLLFNMWHDATSNIKPVYVLPVDTAPFSYSLPYFASSSQPCIGNFSYLRIYSSSRRRGTAKVSARQIQFVSVIGRLIFKVWDEDTHFLNVHKF